MRFFVLAAVALLGGCNQSPPAEPVRPALWQVTAPDGQDGWLFGTIHALPEAVAWRSDTIDDALDDAGEVLVEVASLDAGANAAVFARLATSPGLPPLSQRVTAAGQKALGHLLAVAQVPEEQFASTETWAAAITLANRVRGPRDARHGIDRALLAEARRDGTPVRELEGAERQFQLFDTLPEADQLDLLAAVADGARTAPADAARLAKAWKDGDIALLSAETRRGLLADPQLYEALYAGRNRAWSAIVAARIRAGARPFVAVGAAHVAGEHGLPKLLAVQGFTVTRVQ